MKIRSGWVSNSSSTSYYIMAPSELFEKAKKKFSDREQFFYTNSFLWRNLEYLGKRFCVFFGEIGSNVGKTAEWNEFVDEREVLADIIDRLKAVDPGGEILILEEE